jgi:hypothetical protein
MAIWTPNTTGLVFEHRHGTDLATSAYNHATGTTTASVNGSWTGGTGFQDISGTGPKGLDYGFMVTGDEFTLATVVDPSTTGLTILGTTGSNAALTATARLWLDTNPANNETITLNGQAITFKTSGATGFEVNIGATLQDTAAGIAALINAQTATFAMTAYCPARNSVMELTANTAGTAGNSIALATAATACRFTARNGTANVAVMGSGAAATASIASGITQLSQNFRGHNHNQGAGGLAATTTNPAGTAGYHYVSVSGYLYDFPVLRRYAGGVLVERVVGTTSGTRPETTGNIMSGTTGGGTGSAKQAYAAHHTLVLSDAEDLAQYLAVQAALLASPSGIVVL